jgi:hypothetical protein
MVAGTVYKTENIPILTINFSNLSVLVPSLFIIVRILKRETNPASKNDIPIMKNTTNGASTNSGMYEIQGFRPN